MSSTGYREICAEGNAYVENRLAGGAGIKPGHLLAISSGAVILHATAEKVYLPLVADVAEYREIDNSSAVSRLADAYANGDTVKVLRPQKGAKLNMRIADAQTLVDGVSVLLSTGDGTLSVVAIDAADFAGTVHFIAAESKVTAAAGELAAVYVA
jgi:hypothetical protein